MAQGTITTQSDLLSSSPGMPSLRSTAVNTVDMVSLVDGRATSKTGLRTLISKELRTGPGDGP